MLRIGMWACWAVREERVTASLTQCPPPWATTSRSLGRKLHSQRSRKALGKSSWLEQMSRNCLCQSSFCSRDVLMIPRWCRIWGFLITLQWIPLKTNSTSDRTCQRNPTLRQSNGAGTLTFLSTTTTTTSPSITPVSEAYLLETTLEEIQPHWDSAAH